jgi:predicted Rossmann fold flavoprotein
MEGMSKHSVLVIGGGAAGYFAAVAAAERLGAAGTVVLCEATAHPLAKVRISGGGRCNVTHDCMDPRELVKRYPRGGRELLGAFHRFGPRDTIAWFAERGVTLKTEADGRMFPITDDSATIVDCLQREAARFGVDVRTRWPVSTLRRRPSGGFVAESTAMLRSGATASGATTAGATTAGATALAESAGPLGGASARDALEADSVILATGGTKTLAGGTLAESLGHTIEPPVPSLFTFHCRDPRLDGLAGLAVADAEVAVPGTDLRRRGPVLITHAGLSGPAILTLSAWGARDLAKVDYRFRLTLNVVPGRTREQVREVLRTQRTEHPRRRVSSGGPFAVPLRLWERLALAAGIGTEITWSHVSTDALESLVAACVETTLAIEGKSLNKEEFVTCGGVRRTEIDFRSMASRSCPGLYVVGEALDVDGVTGGFNFQAAWTTGWLAGHAAAEAALPERLPAFASPPP